MAWLWVGAVLLAALAASLAVKQSRPIPLFFFYAGGIWLESQLSWAFRLPFPRR
jgi:hypothetical protein